LLVSTVVGPVKLGWGTTDVNQAGEAIGPVAGQPPLTGTGSRSGAVTRGTPPRPPQQAVRRLDEGVRPRDDSFTSLTSLRRLSELGGGSPSRSRGRRRSGRARGGRTLFRIGWLLVALVLVGLGWAAWRKFSAGPTVDGLRDGEVVTPTALTKREITVSARTGSAVVRLDGQPVAGVTRDGSTLRFTLPPLVDGSYRLSVTSGGRPFGKLTTTRRFQVDGTPPAIGFATLTAPVPIDRPVVLQGTVKGAHVLKVPGADVSTDGDHVKLAFGHPPAGPVRISAIDRAGNQAVATIIVPVRYPRTNGVHVSAKDWADPAVKAEVLKMITDRRINSVELDLKDERGVVGYNSKVALAKQIGAVRPSYDLRAAVAQLHALKVRVIGRVVAFLDPILSDAAWARGDHDWVLQAPDHQPLKVNATGGFTNYVKPEVRAYNLAVAEEAARAGVDDILWDYVRRPEGSPASMVVPGLKGLSSDAIADFLRQGQELLRPLGVYQGAAVFGISVTRPQSIAQNIPLMAQHVDYLAPMLYPERWGRTEYNVADPQAQPYDIVFRSLADFQAAVVPLGRALVPWLQDYSGRIAYGPPQVLAQIKAVSDRGDANWLFWNPHGRYSTDGYPPLH
jgi:hypothetical protein